MAGPNLVAIRMLSQRLAGSGFSSPQEVVAHFGAMQAQDYRMMRWAVAMRTSRPSAKAFTKAYDEGSVIRLHLHRGTWQLVSRDDYWWMLRLCGPKSEAAIKGWMHSNRVDIPADELARIRDILVDASGSLGSATKDDFTEALARKDIVMDQHRLSYHIRLAELSGTLCSGDLHPSKATYTPAEKKAGAEPYPLERDEALARLARQYFRSHSPATLEDFVWWSGLGVGDCRRAITVLGDELHTVQAPGREFYIHESCRTSGYRGGRLVLLPPYDEYLVGYKSRDVVLDSRFSHKAHNKTGIFYPVVLSGGRVCGNWKPGALSATVDLSAAEAFSAAVAAFDGCTLDPAAFRLAADRYVAYRGR